MAGSPAPSTAAPRWRSERSRWPRAASCCLPAGRGVRRCHASPRRHRRGRCFNLAGALVGGLEVDGGARSVVGPSMPLQIVDVPRPRWPATRLHLGGLELDFLRRLAIFCVCAPSAARAPRPPLHPRPDAPRAHREPGQKTNPCSPCLRGAIPHLLGGSTAHMSRSIPLTSRVRWCRHHS